MDYYAVVTNKGQALIAAAIQSGEPLKITKMCVGDGNGKVVVPDKNQTSLVNQVWEGSVSSYVVNSNVITASTIIPHDTNNFVIREMGLLDSDNNLIAIANVPDTTKVSSNGVLSSFKITIKIAIENTDAITFVIESSYDDELSDTSVNAIQNKVVAEALKDYVSRSEDSTVAKNVKINFASTAQSISGDKDNLYLNASEYIVAKNTLKLEYSGSISENVDYAVSGKAVYNYIQSFLTPTEITTENLNDLSEGIYWGDYNNNAVNKPENAKNFYLRVISIDRNGNTENLIENGDCVPVKKQVMLVGSNTYQRSYMLEYEGEKTYYWTDWRTI